MIRLITACVALGLAPSGSALAQQSGDDRSPQQIYEEKAAKIKKALADKHADIGNYLAGQKMHEWGRKEYYNALWFEPAHEKANKGLGFTVWNEMEKKWESDPDAKPPEIRNLKKGDDADRVWAEYQKKLEALRKSIGKMYEELGEWCDKKLPSEKDKAEDAFKLAIEYDPLNKDARKRMGHVKIEGGGWFSKEEVERRKRMKEGVAKAPKGQAENTQTDTEQKLSLAMKKQASEHFLIEAPHLDEKTLQTLIQYAEHAYAMFCEVYNQTALFGQRQNLTILQNRGQHEKWVDAYVTNASPEFKKLARESIGVGDECYQGDRGQTELEDWVIHRVVMKCSEALAGGERHWLHEGLAYYFSRLMHDTALTHCTDLQGTGAGGSRKNYSDASTWHIVIKEWLRTGKDDPDINKIIKCNKLSELKGGDPVKSWSLVEFLTVDHREKFIDFMQRVRALRQEDDEKTFQKVFRWTLGELDNRWKIYARAAYLEAK